MDDAPRSDKPQVEHHNLAGLRQVGDGNRVKATLGGATTVYIGIYFEWTSSTSMLIKYFYAGTQRVAMKKGSTVYY